MTVRQILLCFLLLPACFAANAQVNSIRTWHLQRPNITNATTIASATSTADAIMSTQYLDGLGRPVQTVRKSITSLGKDMVEPVVYDIYGREQLKYLSYISSGNDGTYKISAVTDQQAFYSDVNSPIKGQGETLYYGQTDYEPSPLNRVHKVFAAGDSWVGSRGTSSEKSTEVQYGTNTTPEGVRIWTIGEAAGSLPQSASAYTTGLLYRTLTTDEAKHQVIEYKDGEQRVILKKVQLSATPGADHTGWLCTYYIYDDFNNLRFVLQPRAVELITSSWTLTQSIADELCFRYAYDNRQRLVIKKVPGASEVGMVYDNRDRLVYTQDGNMHSKTWWLTTIYDNLNRPVQTGMLTNSSNRGTFQNYVNGLTSGSVTIDAAGTGINTVTDNLVIQERVTGRQNYHATASIEFNAGFISEEGANFIAEIISGSPPSYAGTQNVNMTALPPGAFVPLTMTFYDNYDFTTSKTYNTTNNNSLNDVGTNSYGDALPALGSTLIQGMTTGARVRTMEDANDLTKGKWMETATFYDNKGRVVQTQSENYKAGLDIVTTRYDFTGRPLTTYLVHNNSSGGVANLSVKTVINYDVAGRPLNVQKTINNAATKQIFEATYNELGQLKTKKLGKHPANTANPLEALNYDYNIRGWLLGINRDYAKSTAASGNFFGFDLGYDKTQVATTGAGPIGSYTTQQYNGNIGGTVWKSVGDGEIRKYDFAYDNVNRLSSADFNQYTSTSFNKSANIDFSVSNLSYDANGNILKMKQMGLKLAQSSVVDDLTYNYNLSNGINTYSNKLQNVVDATNSPQTALGDFRYSVAYDAALSGNKQATATDYNYDANGSMTQDRNKDISSISYNYLNLPSVVTVTDKGTITYIYDATGNKLEKRTVDNTSTPSSSTTTTYIGNFIYQNNVLQFLGHEEGRIRPIAPTPINNNQSFAFDYFLKDHLGNIRSVLSDEVKQQTYPAATLEEVAVTTEAAYYDIKSGNVRDKSNIASFANAANNTYQNNNGNPPYNNNPNSNTTGTSNKLYRLNGATGDKTGLGITLKVMAGDNVSMWGKSYWHSAGVNPNNNYPITSTLLDFLSSFAGSSAVSSSVHGAGISGSVLNNTPTTTAGLTSWLNNDVPTPSDKPKAYINWILFDEQFKPVTSGNSGSGFIPAGGADAVNAHSGTASISKNGFLYVYCSNESDVDVFFDNLQVIHNKGPLVEETHYYPFGLTMAGISSKAAGSLQNRNKFNSGNELQDGEFSDGSGLETYDAVNRMYDPQLGRFFQIDELGEANEDVSSYSFSHNNPIVFNDPLGLIDGLPGETPAVLDKVVVKSYTKNQRQQIYYDLRNSNTSFDRVSNIPLRNWLKNHDAVQRHMDRVHQMTREQDLIFLAAATWLIPETKILKLLKLKKLVALYKLKRGKAVITASKIAAKTAEKGVSVLGKTDDYIRVADELGAKRFSIPSEIWKNMDDVERWAANTKFLDRMIARGDEVVLSNSAYKAEAGSVFAKEIEYMVGKGYSIAEDGMSLIK
jgi:RHS repeat-associated protein